MREFIASVYIILFSNISVLFGNSVTHMVTQELHYTALHTAPLRCELGALSARQTIANYKVR